mmetsp:Transcript_27811/g.28057  ORF Transcript_27811/g.28057 Transcript_27811/m.28057 type:complete len:454 (+) Transcript_27811:190-1551(+)|eukprot:CAMPEP_0182426586 /NCGR_PEP_ID=MMETSP1167-20130531/13093_1 /TAXON_ID=2988 /ORGANISM="Mallomonas Sp, Strain CCMP3275" /LENGTH=453 /DNA_ID=CAMNT_0024608139 /DNA_START=138 /DNA_END=1502 /DNA_ORIENTATION=-
MPLNDFRVQEAVGKGSFASVYKVTRKSDNKIYALKRVKIGKMSKKEISDALNEIRFLASIRHHNIVGFLEAFLEDNDTELCIIMEYCGAGDLAAKVERYKKRKEYIDEQIIWRYLIQSLKALQHLHEKGICHRDLKTSNCFLAEDGSIKVGDMNVSKRLKGGQLQTQIGTPYYMSPEIWNNRPYDASSDMWALGCMIYELCALKPPFLGDSFPALKRAVTGGRFNPIPRKYSEPLHRVINALIRVNPRERPSADVLMRSPELAGKLQLDDGSTSFAQPTARDNKQNLLETIKVPQNMKKLNTALPKPCYPDVRPNSPSSWTVAEQKQSKMNVDNVEQRRPALNRLPNIDEDKDKDNYSAPALRREVVLANEGRPAASERGDRAPLRQMQPASGNANANAPPAAKKIPAVLASVKAQAVPTGAGYRPKQINSKYQQPTSVSVRNKPQYVPHRMW